MGGGGVGQGGVFGRGGVLVVGLVVVSVNLLGEDQGSLSDLQDPIIVAWRKNGPAAVSD